MVTRWAKHLRPGNDSCQRDIASETNGGCCCCGCCSCVHSARALASTHTLANYLFTNERQTDSTQVSELGEEKEEKGDI